MTMEVHAHSHTPRKKWTHYFWEFIMLFLAVFCGFLAENVREHRVEHLRAKEYAKALLVDFTNDTIEINDVVREYQIIFTCFDSINNIIHKGISNNNVPGRFYYYCTIGTFSPAVVWNNATLTQITQSGNLRYFQNKELVTKLSKYYSASGFTSILNANDSRAREETIKLRGRVLNSFHYNSYSGLNILGWLKTPDSLMNVILPLQSTDPALLNEFANSFISRRRLMNILLTRDYPTAIREAVELIEMLKKEYRL